MRSRFDQEIRVAGNRAAQRFAKANRRKAVVAEKRKAEQRATTLVERVRRAAATPVRHCLVTAGLLEGGMGTLILARGATALDLEVGIFLLDTFCIGVKDALFRSMQRDDFETYMAAVEDAAPLEPIDPAPARKLLRDLVAWAGLMEFRPPLDLPAIEALFGDTDPDASDQTFTVGHEGQPLYIPGPSESPALIARRLAAIRHRFGDGAVKLSLPPE
jgi:hypothetical protein